MTLASLPLWAGMALWEGLAYGLPEKEQVLQALLVAVSSGVIATVLFFHATDLVKNDMMKLAAVEATQSMEILFALAGEMLLLAAPLPGMVASTGMLFITAGIILYSFSTKEKDTEIHRKEKETADAG